MLSHLNATGGVSLTQLAYAIALDTHQHFGKAAEACNVTQPTLSMQLLKLERSLGVTLFDRSQSPVVATDIGRLVLDQARVTLREAARITDIRDAAAGVIAGELRIGIIPTLASSLLPRLIPALQRDYPRLELVVEEWKTEDIVRGLAVETIDAGIVASEVHETGMIEQPLFTEPFVGYISPKHRLAQHETISAQDLSLDDLWLLSEGHCFRTQAVALCNQRDDNGERSRDACTNGTRFESGNLETLIRLVERGLGMTLLPALTAGDLPTDIQRRLIRPFTSPSPARDVRLIRRRMYLKAHMIDAVVTALLNELPESIRAGKSIH